MASSTAIPHSTSSALRRTPATRTARVPVTDIERPEHLTTDWLTTAIGAGTVERFGMERIGTGQMSECYRVALTYAGGAAGPESVVLKVAASDPASRQTGLALG